MQNQSYSKNILNPTASTFNLRARPQFSTIPDRRRPEDALQYEEAWTQYDGLGPVGQAQKDPRLDRNWRAPPRGQSGPARGSAPGRNQRADSPVHQPASKRSKQMPRIQAKGRNNRGQSSGGRHSVAKQEGELIDEAYLARNYPPLKKQDYPNAPSQVFTNPKGYLWDHKGVDARSSCVQRGSIIQSTVLIKVYDGSRFEAIGESQSKKSAERIACQHILLKLHKSGQLKEVIYGGVHRGAFDQNLLTEEQDAKMDIYDYCARFDTVPQITTTETGRQAARKSLIQTTIEMPKQGIVATARATDRRVSDILASVEFKRQAEEWHAKNGDQDILVKDVTNVINSRNAKKFFEFYKVLHPGVIYTCEPRPLQGRSRRVTASMMTAQVILQNEPIGDPVEMGTKKAAEAVAWVTAAVALKALNPQLFPKFINALKLGNGEILKPVQPSWLNIEPDSVVAMTNTLLNVRRIGLPPTEEEMNAMDEKIEDRRRFLRRRLDPALAAIKSQKLLESYRDYLENEKLVELRQKRSELPMNQYAKQVLELVNGNEVSIIIGATGSGKTTQVPQILLEEAIRSGTGADCNVICTQPRRIAATSVAQRVAIERSEQLQKTVGYQVRFDAKLPLPGGSITYCTTGILLQQLRNNPDEVLDGITHLVIDEVHERDIMIDYLLIILKRILKNRRINGRPGVKVVLMSATMNTELFSGYFGSKDPDGNLINCPHLSVPGRTFPVKEFYLEDINHMLKRYPANELGLLREVDTRQYLSVEESFKYTPTSGVTSAVASNAPSRAPSRPGTPRTALEDDPADVTINWKQEVTVRADGQAAVTTEKDDAIVPIGLAAITLAHIVNTTVDGAVLVFLPGLDEILKLDDTLRKARPLGVDFNDTLKFKIYMLHSSIPNQNEVFEETNEGCRKIILSTNIAETSITIPDVKYVVDTGKLREKQYEQARRITQLVCTWISKSNSKQRAGRAGRVQDGNYYALFSRSRFESLRPTGLPEMLRSDLQEICLDIKLQGFSDPIAQFLSEAIEPPAPYAIEASLRQLLALGGIDQNEKLTQLGHVLATMPVEPALGKMILLAVIFRCLDPILILGASAGGRDLFVNPPERRAEATRIKHSFIRGTGSDHMAIINAFKSWRDVRDTEGVYAAHRFAEANFLHRGALKVLEQTAKQVEEILISIGLVPPVSRGEKYRSEFGHPRLNTNSTSVPLIKALTLAGMYPNLAVCSTGRGFRTVSENFTMIHPSSVHYNGRDNNGLPFGTLMTYSAKAKSNDGTTILLRQNTESTPLAALLFGGKLQTYGNTLEIDDWLPFRTKESHGKITLEFKKCLDRLLANAFRSLSKRNTGSTRYLADDPAREVFAQGIVEVLNSDVGANKERYGGNRVDRYRPNSRIGERVGGSISRPNSRNEYPALGSGSNSRGLGFERPGSRPSSRNGYPAPGSGSESRGLGFERPGSRPSSRNGYPAPGSGSESRGFGFERPGSRPSSRSGYPAAGSGSDSRNLGFGGSADARTGFERSGFRNASSRPESGTSGIPSRSDSHSNGFGGTDRYRPDPRLQDRWR